MVESKKTKTKRILPSDLPMSYGTVCLLCRRKFKTLESLEKHSIISDIHIGNLKKYQEQQNNPEPNKRKRKNKSLPEEPNKIRKVQDTRTTEPPKLISMFDTT